jgi:hypothetical protein
VTTFGPGYVVVLLLKTQRSKLHWKQGWQWQLLMCSPADHTMYEDFCSDFLKSAKQYKRLGVLRQAIPSKPNIGSDA